MVAAAQAAQPDEDDEDGRDWRLYLDADATLIICWCDDRDGLRLAAPTLEKGWGTHPLVMYLDRGDGSGESLAGLLRAGNAGSSTAADHIEVLEMVLAALPPLPSNVKLVVRTDTPLGAPNSSWAICVRQGWGFRSGSPSTPTSETRSALPDAAWVQARRQDGKQREGAAVAEITGWLDLSGYPEGPRVVVRREPLHPGAQ
ncbi:MAG: hypothetical protein ACRDYA_22705 [Egibacteraceae bacterium]